MIKRALLPLLLFCFASSSAQNKKLLTLMDVIDLAKTQSYISLQAKNKFRNSYWQYRIYRSAKLPYLNFEGTLPNYFSSIRKISIQDGSDIFTRSEFLSASGGFTLSQNIGMTGGSVFINSSLQQLVLIRPYSDTTFLSTPVNIGFTQPLFSFNAYKWDKKIEPL